MVFSWNPCQMWKDCGELETIMTRKLKKKSVEVCRCLFVAVHSLSCVRLCDPMDCSTPGFPVLHHLPELAQTHVRWVGDVIQPSCPLLSPSPAFNVSQYQGLFQWVSFSHQVAKVLELQHQSFQWIFRVAFKTMNSAHHRKSPKSA